MSVTEIITNICTREDLKVCSVFLSGEGFVRVLDVSVAVFVQGLQMSHVIFAAQTDLNRQLIPEPVTVGDIQRVILRHAVEVRVVRI